MDELQSRPLRRSISSVPLSRTYTNPTESTHILVAQLVLHLLPSPHFSLLVYVLAFFSQVALVHEENGVGIEDLARMFGGQIFGGGQSRRRKISAEIAIADPHEPRMEGEVMMCWFLRRWGPLSEGLFDVIEDAKMGVFQGQQDKLRSLQKRRSVSIPFEDSLGYSEIPNHSSGRDTPFRLPAQDNVPRRSESPEIPHDERPVKIRPNPKKSNTNGSDDPEVYSDKGLDYGKCILSFSFNVFVTKLF